MNKTIDISSGSIIRTIIIILSVWFLFYVRDVLMLVFVSLIIVSAISPVANWFEKRKIPRGLTVLGTYIAFFAVVALAFALLVPLVSIELQNLSQNLPQLLEKWSGAFRGFQDFAVSHNLQQNSDKFVSDISERLSQLTAGIFSGTISVIGGFFSFIVVLSITFYLSTQEKSFKDFIGSFTPIDHRTYVVDLIGRIENKMGRWLQGQLLLMLIIFVLTYVGLLLIGAPYALILAILAGLLEIIPYVGPLISAVLATAFSLLHGWVTGLLVLILFVIVQQLENHVITPQVMKKAVGLNPVVVIIALLVGGNLAGVTGIIIAVPLATAIAEIVKDLVGENRSEKAETFAQ